ncbi:DUF1345 domain-containing protein [Paracoccus aestuariivivens]|uniref:DUF1345 domain-containing protein n=1 Tax=Paracoccus aestuariivivens TaxID=1820333 RepID=A0A6L6JCY4_9RHOB|nr:DUF1345 domain-containing protein [Paracoccus aestuariivivens]MTH79366.1 DUF1345 domain-containing protein [Paracoccus aestuariivivens]
MLADLRRHIRFLLSFTVGLVAGLLPWWLDMVTRLLLFSVTFSLCYLVLTGLLMRRLTTDMLRAHADLDDEGMRLIVPLAMGSVAINLWAILQTTSSLASADPAAVSGGFAWTFQFALALASVPLAWTMIHTVMAFHYAHLWYARQPDGHETRCLAFPGLPDRGEAGIWDFLYYSFVLGMTAQTADISTLGTQVRRITLLHSVFSFVHNTVLLALVVSAIAR